MSTSRRQTFCSFLCCWSRPTDRTKFDKLVSYLPAYRDECLVSEFPQGKFYLSVPNANPLHQWRFVQQDDRICFVQGDFYEVTDLTQRVWSFNDEVVDDQRLAQSLRRLNGVFSGFILNTTNGDYRCFSDRYGFSRAFVTSDEENTVISSSYWPLRECDQLRGKPNVEAVHDTLMFGFPLLGDTLYQKIQMPRPGSILMCEAGQQRSTTYLDYRRNAYQRSTAEILDEFRSICKAHCESMNQIDAAFHPGVALSGGKDSRVALTGLIENDIKPRCYAGYSGSRCWDSKRGEHVGQAAECPTTVIDYSERVERDFDDSNVLINGGRTGLWTMNLAREAAKDGCSVMYFGTTGDVLSGGWSANPKKFGSLQELSDFTLEDYIEYERSGRGFADMFIGRSYDDLRKRFLAGHADDLVDDLSNAAIAFRIMNRNFRRIRTFMSGSTVYQTPVHFFHDTRVSNFYWSLPFEQLMNQRAHAAICAINPRLGRIPSTSFPFGVRFEPMWVPVMQKLIPSGLRTTLRTVVSGKSMKSPPKPVDAHELETLLNASSSLAFSPDRLRDFANNDHKPRLVEQRIMIINTQLEPSALLSRSQLIGQKQFRPLE